MNSPSPLSLGQKLLEWRTRRNYTQEDVGNLLRGVTAPTVGRWEKGQEIPGPVAICLECLLEGKIPFQDVLEGSPVKEAMWKLQMSLEAWERLDALRLAGGYATVTDLIAALVQEELGQTGQECPGYGATRTSDHGEVDEMALVAEESDAAQRGATSSVESGGGALVEGAEAFLQKRGEAGAGGAGGVPGAGAKRTGPARGKRGIPGRKRG